MTIGIGITTTPNRQDFLDLCVSQIEKHTKHYNLFIHNDIEYKGVAYSKNQCLKALKGYDDIFLFDDDCFPIADGWTDWFTMTNDKHLMYLNNWGNIKALPDNGSGIISYNNCAGCMMYLTKEVVEKVGGYCKDYGRYGFEHAGYSIRIHGAGLTPLGAFLSPCGANQYIHSLDYDGPFGGINPRCSLNTKEAREAILINKSIFEKDIETIYQPL